MKKIYCFFFHFHAENIPTKAITTHFLLYQEINYQSPNIICLINKCEIFLVFLILQTFSIIGVDLFYQFLGGYSFLSESNHQVLSVSKILQLLPFGIFILLCLHLSFKRTQFPSHYDSDIPCFSNFPFLFYLAFANTTFLEN